VTHTVNFPTSFQNNHSSVINSTQFHLCSISPFYNGLSDHDASV